MCIIEITLLFQKENQRLFITYSATFCNQLPTRTFYIFAFIDTLIFYFEIQIRYQQPNILFNNFTI